MSRTPPCVTILEPAKVRARPLARSGTGAGKMVRSLIPRSTLSLAVSPVLLALVPLLAAPGLAMTSPWWEDYAIKTRYLCRGEGVLVVERNDAQASIISGRFRTTLFRESSDLAGLRYKTSEGMRLILNGDELTIEQLPQRVQCLRTEEV